MNINRFLVNPLHDYNEPGKKKRMCGLVNWGSTIKEIIGCCNKWEKSRICCVLNNILMLLLLHSQCLFTSFLLWDSECEILENVYFLPAVSHHEQIWGWKVLPAFNECQLAVFFPLPSWVAWTYFFIWERKKYISIETIHDSYKFIDMIF